MTVNRDLAERTLRRIEANPKALEMGTWGRVGECGAVACFCGHAMLESGYRLLAHGVYLRPSGDEVENPYTEGKSLLGFTTEQASEVFLAVEVRSPDGLRELVERVLADTEPVLSDAEEATTAAYRTVIEQALEGEK